MESIRSFPSTGFGLPRVLGGSAPASAVSGPARCYCTFGLQDSPSRLKRPSSSEAPAASSPPPPLRLLPGGANQFPGGNFTRSGPAPYTAHQHKQARHAVTTLEPLINQRGAKAAAVKNARYNLDNCRVYAPFDARVTNLTISEGAYAHVGQQVFTLIDARTWWAIGNFREGQLKRIMPGMKADIYLMSRPNLRFAGVVDSVGFGVTPDPDVFGRLEPGLPDAQRTLNWVHLASRYLVRVRVQNPSPELFRVGESAIVT